MLVSTMFNGENKNSRIVKWFRYLLVQKAIGYISGSNIQNFITGLIILENIWKSKDVAKLSECCEIIPELLDLVSVNY